MDQELCQDFVVGALVLDELEPHIHNDHILIIFNKLLSNLEELLKKFEALVVNQVVE